MIYKWNKEDIYDYYERLMYIIETKKLNKKDSNTIRADLDTLDDIIGELNGDDDFDLFEENLEYADKTMYLPLLYYNYFDQIPNCVNKSILKSINVMKDFNEYDYSEFVLKDKNYTTRELVNLSNDFFNWLPTNDKRFIKGFEYFTNPDDNYIRFRKKGYEDYNGVTYFTSYERYKPYFLVCREYAITDLISLNHELAHGIINKDNNDRDFFIQEVEGHYFNFLTLEYLRDKKYDKKEIEYIDNEHTSIMYEKAVYYYLFYLAIQEINKNNRISIRHIKNNFIFKDFSVDSDLLNDAFSSDPTEFAIYLYSYLISLDLEMLFYKDREYSFYVFNNLTKYCKKCNYKTLRENNISFMDDDFSSLKKKIISLKN